jgi:hypothetical protein
MQAGGAAPETQVTDEDPRGSELDGDIEAAGHCLPSLAFGLLVRGLLRDTR